MNVEAEAIDQLMANDPNLLHNAADELVQEENSWYDVLADFGAWCTRVVVGGACGAISGAIVNGAIGLYFGGPAGMWAGAAAGAVSGAISGAIGGAFSSNLKEAAIGGLIDGAISGGLNGIFTVAAKALAGIDLSLKIGGPAFAMAGGGTIPSTVITVTIPAISGTTISIATGGGVGLIDAYMSRNKPDGGTPKEIFDGIKKSPKYPKGFRNVQNGLRNYPVENTSLLNKLREIEPGKWSKVFKDGYDAAGNRISIHYFESVSGKVFDVKVVPGWSNLR